MTAPAPAPLEECTDTKASKKIGSLPTLIRLFVDLIYSLRLRYGYSNLACAEEDLKMAQFIKLWNSFSETFRETTHFYVRTSNSQSA